MTEVPASEAAPAVPGPVLRGTPIAPGLATGTTRRPRHDLSRIPVRRVPRDQVERELNRFHKSLSGSRRQLEDLRERLRGKVPADHARVLETHVAYLQDSVFLSDVENLILGEQLTLESAIAKVILDFDRIFKLVENEVLRERAVDLRDVGIRVLRNLPHDEGVEVPDPDQDYVLIARELSIVDMFGLDNRLVRAIVTEAGSLSSHAAVLARSMRIPTVTGVEGLLDEVADGDFVIVDAAEGTVHVRPEELVREQFLRGAEPRELARAPRSSGAPIAPRTACGQRVAVAASCGNLPEVEAARAMGMREVGLYRTELLYLIEREPPSREVLAAHYRAVLEQVGAPVTFRLLDADSGARVPFLHGAREPNPQLGRVGVRALLSRDSLLRQHLQALLRAGAQMRGGLSLAVPKVVDCGELRRVREVLFEERLALKKAGVPHAREVRVGAVVEMPAAVLGARSLAREADFLVIGLDSLQQYLLAADRDNADQADRFLRLHPVVVGALQEVVRACEATQTPLSVFGVTAASAANLPLLLGAGLRSFVVAPVALQGFLEALGAVEMGDAQRAVELARSVASPAELEELLEGYGHRLGAGR